MLTIADFLDLLPQFGTVAEPTIQLYLDQAARTVTPDWGEDANPAQAYLAAHLMSMAGIGPNAEEGALAGFTSIRSGGLSLTRADRATMGDYASTAFGRLFWPLFRGRTGGFLVTGTGNLPHGFARYNHGEA